MLNCSSLRVKSIFHAPPQIMARLLPVAPETQEITTTHLSWAGWTIFLHFRTFWGQFKIPHTFLYMMFPIAWATSCVPMFSWKCSFLSLKFVMLCLFTKNSYCNSWVTRRILVHEQVREMQITSRPRHLIKKKGRSTTARLTWLPLKSKNTCSKCGWQMEMFSMLFLAPTPHLQLKRDLPLQTCFSLIFFLLFHQGFDLWVKSP